MLSGPETTRILHQFEGQYLLESEEFVDRPNHEMGLDAQKAFKKQAHNLADVIRRMGNPFLDDFPELVTLDSRDCMDDAVATPTVTLLQVGKTQYQEYLKEVIKDRTISINSPIKKNKLPLFSKQPSCTKSKQSKTIKVLQNNVALFAQLYIAMQNRDADLGEFFSHEVQSFLRLSSNKSELLRCITQPRQPDPPTQFDCKICDGAVIVHCIPVTGVITFDDFAENVFMP